jgi:ribonuclease E
MPQPNLPVIHVLPPDAGLLDTPVFAVMPEPANSAPVEAPAPDVLPVPGHDEAGEAALAAEAAPETAVEAEAPKRRRAPRRRKPREAAAGAEAPASVNGGAAPYAGPTPANPYAAGPLDIFDVLDAHEQNASAATPTLPTEESAAEPPVPVIRPVLVGNAEPAERKRGWWRR